ncbi:hypothetical protein GDO86_012165 [Hymenochirus boettgeri]|uniref:Peptidase S1 domain-containing protein n=1 Tax=Hymenochirus boettgeri TaxID=247094 RepID=A0A8T2IRP0_9PIPI|nr:hypothetical protein GDO86_012165 [Hymenochirus boettgeri]
MLLWVKFLSLFPARSHDIDRIIGGSECVPHSQPWQAALYYFSDFICGGILINEWWVLTAAHCWKSNIQVVLGAHDRSKACRQKQYRYAEKVFPHCSFDNITYDNDIMLLKLESPANISDHVNTATLPTHLAEENTTCLTSGWGSTISPGANFPALLQCVNVTTVNQTVCRSSYPTDIITDNMLCAGDMAGGKDTCEGDSGGPLICDGKLQGITSWGNPVCGLPNKPGIFTIVSNYIDWIQDIMEKELSECSRNSFY